jgi:hypothetical protein
MLRHLGLLEYFYFKKQIVVAGVKLQNRLPELGLLGQIIIGYT